MLKKEQFLTIICLFLSMSMCAMEPAGSSVPVHDLDSALHQRMLAFVRELGINARIESVPVIADSATDERAHRHEVARRLQRAFAVCDSEFGPNAALAKMYLFLQLRCATRGCFEKYLMELVPVEDFLQRCPNFDCWQDSGAVFQTLKSLSTKTDEELNAWVASVDFLRTMDDLICARNAPCIGYVHQLLVNRQIQCPVDCRDSDCEGRKINCSDSQGRESDPRIKRAYDKFQQAMDPLVGAGPTAVRFFLGYFHVDPNVRFGDSARTYTTPLRLAVVRGDVALIRLLRENGADPDLKMSIQFQSVPLGEESARDLAWSFKKANRSDKMLELLSGAHEDQSDAESRASAGPASVVETVPVVESSGFSCRPPCMPRSGTPRSRACALM